MKAESPLPPAWSFACVAVDTLPGFSVSVHVLPEQVPPAAVQEGSHPVTGPPPPDEELLAPLLPGRMMVDPSSPPLLLDPPELELPPPPPSSPTAVPGRVP